MRESEGRKVDIFFTCSYETEISVYGSPNRTENPIDMEDGHAVIEHAMEGDVFTYKAAKEGFYSEHTAFWLTARDIELGRKDISVRELQPIAGNGYEPRMVFRWPDQIETRYFDATSLEHVDRTLLDTPAFSAEKAAHEFTRHAELLSYLKTRLGAHGHLYFLDEERTLPVVIFTGEPLSKSASLESALTSVRNDGKLHILYQAQIHGNEAAAGEGALTVAKVLGEPGGKGGAFLEKADIIMIPRVNFNGAKGYLRGSEGLDLNRDGLRQASEVTKKLHSLFNQVMPEVFIDGHEFNGKKQFAQERDGVNVLAGLDDLQLVCVNNLNRGRGIFEAEQEILKATLEDMKAMGFRTVMFKPSTDGRTSCGYARLRNSMAFLVESCGIGLGKNHIERRVLSQHYAVMSIIEKTTERSEALKALVGGARNELVTRGKRYSAKNTFVLKQQPDAENIVKLKRPDYRYDGELFGDPEKTIDCENFGSAEKERSRPVAYAVSRKAPFAEAVLDILDGHGIGYFVTGEKQSLWVRQYAGSPEAAFLGYKKRVMFEEGACIIYMEQEQANVISSLFEPDTANGKEGESLVQMGVIKAGEKGMFPIYRLEGKLK